ncbi:YdcF family protein [Dyella telluris]|uniref:YdcF family protein n=1 Tax=Dyella telluris TaxID=2763498 RepID=A0A7G8Q449_9GAMM|nr:YdcF family protein [Dyella telluris]QNK01557.1 YdcF family protein [Dyella telluris]
MLTVLLVLLLLAALLHRRRWRKAARAVLALSVLLFFGIGCGALPRLLTRSLQGPYDVEPAIAWAPRNAIVVLGAGTAVAGDQPLQPSFFVDGRLLKAAQLYSACKAANKECHLVASGGDSQDHGEPEAVVYGRALRALGIPEADITLESRSMSTWQNAQFTRPILASYAPQHVVLVTSGIHLRRSLLYFAHFGIVPQPVAGDWINTRREIAPDSWNYFVMDATLHEYLGILRYDVYNLLGWNAPKAPPLGQ